MSAPHEPVLLSEVLELFHNQELLYFVDGTLGAGGHSLAMLESHGEIKRLMGIDQDAQAREIARERLKPFEEKVEILTGNFRKMGELLAVQGVKKVQGILLDIGVSSMHLDCAERGFSFGKEGPLDMRMDSNVELSAADLVNQLPREELEQIFREYGEERHWRACAREVVAWREKKEFRTTRDLVDCIAPVVGYPGRGRIHPTTKIFQGLRIAVNEELEALREGLEESLNLLDVGGILAVITFHSLEDRIVKQAFRDWASKREKRLDSMGRYIPKDPQVTILTKKPLIAPEEEVKRNPRSRCAKLRAILKV